MGSFSEQLFFQRQVVGRNLIHVKPASPCTNLDGSFMQLKESLSLFIDIDECAANTHDCGADAICTNNEGSFTCSCPDGFEGDGKTCQGKKLKIEMPIYGISTVSRL